MGGRTAADKEAFDRAWVAERGQFRSEGFDVQINQMISPGGNGKITVPAMVGTEGNVNVSRGRVRKRRWRGGGFREHHEWFESVGRWPGETVVCSLRGTFIVAGWCSRMAGTGRWLCCWQWLEAPTGGDLVRRSVAIARHLVALMDTHSGARRMTKHPVAPSGNRANDTSASTSDAKRTTQHARF